MKRILSFFLGLLLAGLFPMMGLCEQEAEGVRIERVSCEMDGNSVNYPQLTGLADETVQKKINNDILEKAQISKHLATLATASSSPWGLQVDYQVEFLGENVLSIVISAEGKMPNNRQGQVNTALTWDLRTGEPVTLDQLFSDPSEAVAFMEEIAENDWLPELSGYMDLCQVTPLPQEAFTLSDSGITFWYNGEQVKMLNGKSGSLQFRYEELDGQWLTDGLPLEIGAVTEKKSSEETAAEIFDTVAEGRIPGIPVAIGDAMQQVTESYGLLRTPDLLPQGRAFSLEAAQFRQVFLISDAMQSGWEDSLLKGIQLRRGGMYSLLVGKTERESWLSLLGTPEKTIDLTENMAYSYDLPEGKIDFYQSGEYELRLYSDTDEVLSAIEVYGESVN